MLEKRFGRFVPRFLLRRLMWVETRIEEQVAAFAAESPAGARVLDAGAGESRHRGLFDERRYVGVDLGVGDHEWDYAGLDVLGDLHALPFREGSFDAALNIVTLEHTPRPAVALAEIARALRPGATLLLIAPQQWELHQAPRDYYRYTRHGLSFLLEEAGFETLSIEPLGGYFVLLARRLIAVLNYLQGGLRWIAFPFAAATVGLAGLALPALDFLDERKDYTAAHVCRARRRLDAAA